MKMHKIILWFAVTVIYFKFAKCDIPELDGRIIGGTPASISQFPYQVSLQYYRSHICGGSIIHPNYIVTAAHCVYQQDAKKFTVRIGSTSPQIGGFQMKVCNLKYHPNYDHFGQDNDIAILRLCNKIPFTRNALPIPLPEQNEEVQDETNSIVSGWGYTQEGGPLSFTLLKVNVPVVNQSVCQKLYSPDGSISSNMICAGNIKTGGQDACQGDSGGPLVGNGKLIGIVSWGYGCARPNYPGVYTKVSKYRSWIRDLIGS